jgi:hypothetical protein
MQDVSEREEVRTGFFWETGRKNARRKPRREWKDAARMGERKGADRFWWGKKMERVRVEGLHGDGMIILKRILKKWNRGHGLD